MVEEVIGRGNGIEEFSNGIRVEKISVHLRLTSLPTSLFSKRD
jgi:hypothetical protein